jgi:hypothetical protein
MFKKDTPLEPVVGADGEVIETPKIMQPCSEYILTYLMSLVDAF